MRPSVSSVRALYAAVFLPSGRAAEVSRAVNEQFQYGAADNHDVPFDGRIGHDELPVVPDIVGLPPGDVCHFVAPVRFGRRRADQFGYLLLTADWLRFRGALDVSVTWSKVSAVCRADREIVVTLQQSRRLLRFWCHSDAEAVQGAFIADSLSRSVARA